MICIIRKIADFKPSRSLASILLMILHALSMAALYICAKHLMYNMHPNQVAFMYKFSLLIVTIPLCAIGGLKKNLKTKKIGLHVTRGTFSFMATLSFFYGLQGVNVSDAAAITYLEPAIVLCMGILYFKERLTRAKLTLIICGFIGALFVIKPGFQEFNLYYIYLFFALIFWAINNLSIKVLGRTEKTVAQLFYAMLIGSVFSLPMAIANWKDVDASDVKYLLLLAFFHMVHLIAFFKAFKFSDMSSVIPFDYMRLVFTGIFGYIAFEDVPDNQSIFGYILIVAGGFYLLRDESRRKGGFNKKDEQQNKILSNK